MNDKIIVKIESNEEFKILIDEVIEKTKLKIRKNIFDASVLNDNKKQLISYYENERQKILKKLKKDSWSFRVNFKNDDIKINKEDYDQLFIYTSWEYDYLERIKGFKEYDKEYYLEQTKSIKKDLFKFHKLRLKDIKNNIWLSFFNLNIKELKGDTKENETNDFYPFKDAEKYKIFSEYVKLHIIEPYLDFSYLYQRLLEKEFIKYIKQKAFMKWLFDNDFINEKTFDSFNIKGQFYSLKKATTLQRENNFNNLFKL